MITSRYLCCRKRHKNIIPFHLMSSFFFIRCLEIYMRKIFLIKFNLGLKSKSFLQTFSEIFLFNLLCSHINIWVRLLFEYIWNVSMIKIKNFNLWFESEIFDIQINLLIYNMNVRDFFSPLNCRCVFLCFLSFYLLWKHQ